MPRKPTGSIFLDRGKWYGRVTLGPKDRPAFVLSTCATEAAALERLKILAEITAQLRAGKVDSDPARRLLDRAGSAEGKELLEVRRLAVRLAAGEVRVKTPAPPPAPPLVGVALLDAPSGPGVYFVRQGLDGLIKIGVAINVRTRVSSLQTANPTRLHYLGAVLGAGKAEETALHLRFAGLREHGEWFRPGAELLAFIVSTRGAALIFGA